MDVTAWAELVRSLGLPIVLIGAMAWFIFKLWKQSAERENKSVEREQMLYAELAESRKVNEKAIATIAKFADTIGEIKEDVRDIKSDITLINAKMDHE